MSQPETSYKPEARFFDPKTGIRMTLRQMKFVEFYLETRSSTEACIRAGYNTGKPRQRGSVILKHPRVQQALAIRHRKMIEELDATPERVILELARIAFLDPGDLYDDQGEPLPIHKMPRRARAAISQIDTVVTERVTKRGTVVRETRTIVKTHNKNDALDKLARHGGIYRKDNEQRKENALTSILEAITQAQMGSSRIGRVLEGSTVEAEQPLLHHQREREPATLSDEGGDVLALHEENEPLGYSQG